MPLPRLVLLVCAWLLALAAHAADGGPVFDILEFDVGGNSVLGRGAVESAVYPHLGYKRTLRDVEAARAALEQSYHKRGFLTVSVVIPEQSVGRGVVRLEVVEGRVENLKVSGNRYYSRRDIREQAPALAPGEVPHFPSVQDQLGELSRTPDRRVTPLLRPGQAPGRLEVELAVEDKLPLHGSLELSNRRSPDTSAARLEAAIRYDNLFQKQHSAGLSYVVSPQDPEQVQVYVASYTVPLGGGRTLSLYALRSESNVASAIAGSTVTGEGTTFGARLGLPLPKPSGSTAFFHTVSLGFDYKDFNETTELLGADQRESALRYTTFSAQYGAVRLGDAGDLTANATIVTGLRTGDRPVNCQGVVLDQFACRRFGAQPNFIYLRGDVAYTRRFLGWEVLARGDFQAAGQPLVSNGQFLAGGADSVRGYLEAEAAGDRGVRLRTEVKTPSLTPGEPALRAVAFVEGAELTLQDALPGQKADATLIGGGLGLRLTGPRGLTSSLDWAQALHDGPRTARGGNRIHVRLNWSF